MITRKIQQSILSCLTIISLFFLITACSFHPKPPFRQAYINGNILTMDADSSVAEAVFIEQEKIVAVGNNTDIRELIDDGTIVFDLKGKTMMPGFIDAHGHFPGSGLSAVAVNLNSPPIGNVSSIKQALELLKKKAEQTPEGKWIFGYGYDDTILNEKRHFNRYELDKISTEHPIYLMHISAHLGVANSYALREANINRNTPNPIGGEIHKNVTTGELTGLLLETAHNPLREMATHFSFFEKLDITKTASGDYISKGVTTAQNGLAEEEHIKGLAMATRLGITPIRMVVWPNAANIGARILKKEADFSSKNSDRFHTGAIKLIADGSIQGYTGYLGKPYHIQLPSKARDYLGYPTLSAKELNRQVKEFHSAGHQLAIHGNGDAAIDMIMDAFEAAQENQYRSDARPIIIHSQMIRDDQIDRAKRLGMTLSFFSAHTYYWGDRHRDIFIGHDRAEKISPAKSAFDKGVPFTLHLDTPVVPMDPMRMIWTAVHRLTTSGKVLGKDERIPVMQALRATTIDAAWQIFQEKNRGSVEPGKFADLIVLSEDPVQNPDKLLDIRVEKTLIGGVRVYQR